MKKSLLMILGAALLMVGCTKELETEVTDLSSRLDAIEAQVAANKAAIEELQKADFISAVEETSAGWTVTLSNGKKLYLYNGKDGAAGKDGADGKDGKDGENGDAYFQSVTVVGNTVVIVLMDGTTMTIPFAEEFSLTISGAENICNAIVPNAVVKLPYTVVGANSTTTVNAIAGGEYTAEVADGNVVITCPETIKPARILVYADNGQGKTSIRSIDVEAQKVTLGKVSAGVPFWSGTVTFSVASNVDVTLEQDAESQGWLTITRTKATTTKEYSAKGTATPYMDARYAKIAVKDPAGVAIDTIKITQWGTGHGSYITANVGGVSTTKWFDTFADAIAFGETADPSDVAIYICGNYAGGYSMKDVCVIPNGTKKNWVLRRRGPEADPSKYIIKGVDVEADGWHNMFGFTIKPTGEDKYVGTQFNGYPYGIVVGSKTTSASHVTVNNVNMVIGDEFKAANGTILAVDIQSGAIVNYTNVKGDANGCRYAQLYGGTVKMDSNTITNSYSSYAVRIGGAANVTLSNNLVDTPKFANVHSSCNGATVTFGDGTTDNNHYSKNVTVVASNDAAAGTATILPASAVGAPGAASGNVTLNGYGFSSVTDAVNFASNGDVIEIAACTMDEVVRVANGKNVTIKGAGKEATVINGGLEISGSATVKDLTIKSKNGVTTNECAVKTEGDGYDWGHLYLVRIEKGASDVVLDNVIIDATDNTVYKADGTTKVCDTMTSLFISECTNVTVSNCTVNSAADGAYCGGQVYGASVVYKNDIFNGGGAEGWATRVAGASTVTVDGCEFHSTIAVDVYKSLTGSLTLGDGSADNNIYGSEVTSALNGDKDALVAAGAVFAPADVVFNQPTTEEGAGYKNLWHLDMVAAGIADSRNFTFDGTNVIAGCTAAASPMVAVRGGQIVANLAWDSAWTNGFTGAKTGLTAIKNNGKTNVLVCNVASIGNKWAATNLEFDVYRYDDLNTVSKVLTYTFTEDNAERMGDYLCFKGTWQDGEIIVCAANTTGKYAYVFPVKDGVATQTPTLLTISSEVAALHSGTSGLYWYKDDIYVLTNEGKSPVVVKRTAENTLELVSMIDLTKITNVANSTGDGLVPADLRTPKFFTLNGQEYMAGLVGTYNGSNWAAGSTAYVCVIPINGGDLVASLNGIAKENVQAYPVSIVTNAGNGFAGLDIYTTDNAVYVGYGIRQGELGLMKFRNR